jgi:hypothetical protein
LLSIGHQTRILEPTKASPYLRASETLSFPEERVEEETSLFLADERFLEPTIFESNQRKKKNKKESVFCVCVWCKIFFLQRRERFIGRERRRKKR